MKIVFISNWITPHQIPFCERMYQICGDGFRFLETMPENADLPIGWQASNKAYPWAIDYDSFHNDRQQVEKRIMDADVVFIGSAPDTLIVPRLKKRKLTFKYSERFYKTGIGFRNFLHILAGAWLHHGRFQKYPLYMLCSSAYTAADCSVFHLYKNRCYRFGYFPPLRRYAAVEDFLAKKNPNLMVWVGRLIDWKHPEVPIEVAKRLKCENVPFHLEIIGSGDMLSELEAKVEDLGLCENVSLLGGMTPDEVRSRMETAGIFLFTSDFQEGWGAVANEAMNSGCAIVASHAIGSVPFLIQNGENGFLYKNGDIEDIYSKTKYLLETPVAQRDMGAKAICMIETLWNADVAADRLVCLSKEILAGNESPNLYEDGPCSRATILKNDWFEEEDKKI